MDYLSRLGIDMNDPSTWSIDPEILSGSDLDRMTGVKRFFGRFFGTEFADNAESAITRGRNGAKRRKLDDGGGRISVPIYSRLSPIITGSHALSFYDDPRDKLLSDLEDQDEATKAEHCCDRCQHMTGTVEGLRSLMSAEGYEHYPYDEIRHQSEANGCSFCDLIKRMMSHCNICNKYAWGKGIIRVRGILEEVDTSDQNPFTPRPRLQALKLEIPTDPEKKPDLGACHDHEPGVLAFQESPVARYVEGSRPDKKLTPELVRRIRQWLNDCQDNHKRCPGRCKSLLPTRVVDIGDSESSLIRLHISPSGARGQYAALSYCWGGDQAYKTTTANIEEYKTGICLSTFPRTIADAIKVCRAIGLRYVWIDALCIIQDDNEDKIREIGQMGRIYKDATVTVMAASAKSAYEGFLKNGKIDAPEAKLPFHIDKDSFGAVFVRSPFAARPYFFDEEPIFNRAWTLQEMLLSSRIIMFDSYQVTLKCGQKKFWPALDTYLHPEARLHSTTSSFYSTLKEFHLESMAKEYLEDPSAAEDDSRGLSRSGFSNQCLMWSTIMAEYSRRDLSVLNDRYSALAGVTDELQKIWADEYVAGFWKKSLVQHLGWVGGVNLEDRYAGKVWDKRLEGPSWSWMSHPSSISINPVAITDVEVLGYEIEPVDLRQPFGPAKRGSLVLEGRTLPLSALEAFRIPNQSALFKRAMAIMPEALSGLALDFPEPGIPDGEIKALALGITFSEKQENCINFLVLRRLECDTYERIGLAILHTAFSLETTAAIMKKAVREVVVIE